MQHVATQEHRRHPARREVRAKVYLVSQHLNLARPGEPNVRIIAATLTKAAARKVVDANPGTFITKVTVGKTGAAISPMGSLSGD